MESKSMAPINSGGVMPSRLQATAQTAAGGPRDAAGRDLGPTIHVDSSVAVSKCSASAEVELGEGINRTGLKPVFLDGYHNIPRRTKKSHPEGEN